MKNMENKDFAVEVISKGQFIDDKHGGSWGIETATVRVNDALLNAWNETLTVEQADKRCRVSAKDLNMKNESLKNTIATLAGFHMASNVKQVVSEIFAIVQMTELHPIKR